MLHIHRRRRCGGAARMVPPKIGDRPCIYQFLTHFPQKIWVCPSNIFDKSTPVYILHRIWKRFFPALNNFGAFCSLVRTFLLVDGANGLTDVDKIGIEMMEEFRKPYVVSLMCINLIFIYLCLKISIFLVLGLLAFSLHVVKIVLRATIRTWLWELMCTLV